jgi:hypothetical protein
MKRIILLTVLCFSVLLNQSLNGQHTSPVNDSLGFEILLTGEMYGEAGIKGNFINSIEITPERLVLLSTSDQYYLLGWGGIVPQGSKMPARINSFAFTGDGLLLTVEEKSLCYFDSSGKPAVLYTLPVAGMSIAAGRDVMYLYDSDKGDKTHPLYVLARGGKYLKLVETPAPITSVVETDNYVLFASGASIYSMNVPGKEIRLLYTDKEGKMIISLAYDSNGKSVYFSTPTSVSAIKGSEIVIISENTGGILRYFNGLIVFDPSARLIMRIVGLDGTLPQKPHAEAPPAPQPEAPLPVIPQATTKDIEAVTVITNNIVCDLVRSNLSDNLIKDIIRRSEVDFVLTTDAIIDLSGKGVSSGVILEMREAMKKKSGNHQIK